MVLKSIQLETYRNPEKSYHGISVHFECDIFLMWRPDVKDLETQQQQQQQQQSSFFSLLLIALSLPSEPLHLRISDHLRGL